MLIAQITDFHIVEKNNKYYGFAHTSENLALCVENINQLIPKPDLVLVTGDITNTGLEEECKQASLLLSKLKTPYYIIPGNHDNPTVMKKVFNKHCPIIATQQSSTFINYVIDDYDLRLIAVDSTYQDHAGGELCETRLTWLDEQLAKDTLKPTIIFMHHPPVNIGVNETDLDGFIGAEKLGKIIEKYNNIERIISGHVHLQTHTRWHGTIITTAPSVSMKLVLDLTKKKPSQFVLEAPSYLLHYWTPAKNLVTHTVNLGKTDGPYLFAEH